MWFDSSNFGSWLLCYKYFPFFKKTNKKSGLTIWCLRTKYQAEYFKYKVNDRFRGPQKYLSKIFHLNSRIGRRNSIYLSREHLVELLPIFLFLCWNSIRWKLVVSKSNFYLNRLISNILQNSFFSFTYFTFMQSSSEFFRNSGAFNPSTPEAEAGGISVSTGHVSHSLSLQLFAIIWGFLLLLCVLPLSSGWNKMASLPLRHPHVWWINTACLSNPSSGSLPLNFW